MKKNLSMILALVLVFAMLFTGCAPKTEAPAATEAAPAATEAAPVATEATPVYNERVIRFGTTSASGSTAVHAIEYFAEEVNKASGGKITVEIYPDGVLGSIDQLYKSVQLGALDMCFNTPGALVNVGIKEFSVFAMPFLFANFEQGWDVLESEIGQKLMEDVTNANVGMVGIGYFKAGPRSLFTTEPVTKLEDLAGKQIRVMATEIDTAMMECLGASPTPVASAEVYSAIQTGVVDGAENPLDLYNKNQFYEVAPYLTLTEHTDQPVLALYSATIWNTLNADEQQLIRDCWKKAEAYGREEVAGVLDSVIAELEGKGVTVIELTDKEKWVEACQPLYDEFGAEFMDIIDQIRAMS